jgi:hypothetical protein
MAQYQFSIDGLALVAATAKTAIELGSAATDRAKIVEWWVEYDGVTATAIPVKVEVGRFSAAVTTATTGTPSKLDPADGTAATVVKHSTTTEGAGTAEAGLAIHRIHPQGGLLRQAPLGREEALAVSTFWRVRCTAAAAVNVTVGVIWEE